MTVLYILFDLSSTYWPNAGEVLYMSEASATEYCGMVEMNASESRWLVPGTFSEED